jgi:maltose O-acetyltransferase
MLGLILNQIGRIKGVLEEKRAVRRWQKLEELGMQIGKDVFLPMSTWIDDSYCFLISIGDRCAFGPNCAILAHDATMNEILDAGRIGRVIIHESCKFGYGTVILPGVEIGPRVISVANSVISRSIPPDSVVSGIPAKVIGSFKHYVAYHAMKMKTAPSFTYQEFGADVGDWFSAEKKNDMIRKLGKTCGYTTGGYRPALKSGRGSFSGKKSLT